MPPGELAAQRRADAMPSLGERAVDELAPPEVTLLWFIFSVAGTECVCGVDATEPYQAAATGCPVVAARTALTSPGFAPVTRTLTVLPRQDFFTTAVRCVAAETFLLPTYHW